MGIWNPVPIYTAKHYPRLWRYGVLLPNYTARHYPRLWRYGILCPYTLLETIPVYGDGVLLPIYTARHYPRIMEIWNPVPIHTVYLKYGAGGIIFLEPHALKNTRCQGNTEHYILGGKVNNGGDLR